MTTLTARTSSTLHGGASLRLKDERLPKKKKEQRIDIWSNLLRRTREAQARSKTQAVQCRRLLICGGTDDDQRAFANSIARPPPIPPPSRTRDPRPAKPKGEVRLSNRFAYGYGHVTLFSPPQQGVGLLETEAEEAAKIELHTIPEPDPGYLTILRTILKAVEVEDNKDDNEDAGTDEDIVTTSSTQQRAAVAILLSWKEPWKFLTKLRQWVQMLSIALLPPDATAEDPLDVIKEFGLSVTIIVQHVEAQETLEREGYKEESFDQISQFLRTCVLPISAGLAYTHSSPAAQQPGSALNELQKVVFTSLGLDLLPLSPTAIKGSAPTKREDLTPKHNVVDRMAIIVPSGWDSVGKIRLLSEAFSPESILEAWRIDLGTPYIVPSDNKVDNTKVESPDPVEPTAAPAETATEQAVYATSEAGSASELIDENSILEPSQQSSSGATAIYEQTFVDPYAHKIVKPPTITVTTKPDQEFLAEMRLHLQELEAHDAARARTEKPSTGLSSTTAGRIIGLPAGEQTGALDNLGDVSFNVGGVSYNTVSAEAAIERLRRPRRDVTSPGMLESHSMGSSGGNIGGASGVVGANAAGGGGGVNGSNGPGGGGVGLGISRTLTPRPKRGDDVDFIGMSSPAGTPSGKTELPSVDKLEEYFASLMKKGGGGSASGTPSKPPT